MGFKNLQFLGFFKDKIKILTTHNVPWPKFAANCRKTATFGGSYFFKIHDTAERIATCFTA